MVSLTSVAAAVSASSFFSVVVFTAFAAVSVLLFAVVTASIVVALSMAALPSVIAWFSAAQSSAS